MIANKINLKFKNVQQTTTHSSFEHNDASLLKTFCCSHCPVTIANEVQRN